MSFRHRRGQRPIAIPLELQDRVQVIGRASVEVIQDNEWWFEGTFDDGQQWTVAYRMVQQHGHPVIAEVRVFPAEKDPRMPPGEWSGVYLGHAAVVPEGGITARLLKHLRPGDTRGSDIAEGRDAWKRYMGLDPRIKQQFSRAGFRQVRKPRAGRRGWSDGDLLAAAAFYVERGGRTPVVALAQAKGLERSQARDLLQAAQKKGLLTPGTRGRTSRALTDKAKRLLAGKRGAQS
jgi:hypothetical protein